MARSEILVALERQYAVALGLYEVAEHAIEPVIGLQAVIEADARIQAEKKKLRLKMERITYLIRVQCDPEWDPGHIRPTQPRKRTRKVGEVARAAYGVLKKADRPLRVREIAHLVAPVVGVDNADYLQINRLHNSIHMTLEGRLRDGMVFHDGGTPKRWSVTPRKRARAV